MGDFEGLYIAQLMQVGSWPSSIQRLCGLVSTALLVHALPLLRYRSELCVATHSFERRRDRSCHLLHRRTIVGRKDRLAAGLVYALSPFALYYEGYVWLSSQPMTFFAMLSVCLVLRNRPVPSFSALAVAILFKQEVLFLLPFFLFLVVHQNKRQLPGALAAFSGILIAVSLPFLVASPRGYLDSCQL